MPGKMGSKQVQKINNFYHYLYLLLKLGMYYLRSRPAVDPIKFTVDVESLLKNAGHIEVERIKSMSKETLKLN